MSELTYQSIAVSNLSTAIALWDRQGDILWANTVYEELKSNYPATVAKVKSALFSMLDLEKPTQDEDNLWASTLDERFEAEGKKWQIVLKPIANEQHPSVAGLVEIISIQAAEIDHSKTGDLQPAASDPLTGVLNRTSFDAELARWLADAREKPFALLFLDLDNFKQINDQHGHLEGDACLREIGGRLLGALRSGDIIGRFGGDEFCLLIDGVTNEKELLPLADRLKQAIKQNYLLPGGEVELRASLGWAFSTPDSAPADLLHEADRAMYAQKRLTQASLAAASAR